MQKLLLFILLYGFSLSFAHAQGDSELTTRDQVEITYKAEAIIKELENLMNVISNSDLYKSEIEDLIKYSYGQSSNKIFQSPTITVEYDIDPASYNPETSRDVSVEQYLKDLNVLYTKSDAPSITFKNIESSKIYKADYTYIRVYFESQFSNAHKTIKTPYKPTKRVAEIRVDRLDKQWEAQIVSIVFFDESEPIETADYKEPELPVLATSNIVTAVDQDSVQLNLRLIQEERKRQEEMFNKLMDEVKKIAEKEEEQKKETSKKLIEEGDTSFAEGDFEQALQAYREAKLINPYQTVAFSKINRTQKAIRREEQKKLEAEKYYNALIADAAYEHKIKNYQEAIELLKEAQTLKPRDQKVSDDLRQLEQLIIPLKTLETKFRAGDFNGGVKDYNKAIRDAENNPDLYLGRGKCYMKMGKTKQAINDFTQSIQLYPDYLAAYVNRAAVYKQEQDYPLAIADLSMALSLDRKNIELHVERSEVNQLAGNLDAAISDYSQAIEIDSLYGKLYLERGLIYRKKSDTDQAIQDFSRAVKVTPELADAWYQRGLCRIEQDDIPKAASDFAQARNHGLDLSSIQQIRQIATGHYNVGKTYSHNNEVDAAIEAYTKAVTITPDYTEAWYGRGECYDKQKDPVAANKDYTEAVRHNPDYYMAFYKKGVNLISLGEYSRAANELETAVKIKNDFFDGFNALGHAYRLQDLHQEALKAYTRSLNLNDEQPEAWFYSGLMKANLNNHSGAIENYSEALKLRKQYPEAAYYRGLSYVKVRDDRKAITDFTDAINNKAGYAEAFYERGKAFSRTESWQEAGNDFTSAINAGIEKDDVYFLRGITFEKQEKYANALKDFEKTAESVPALKNADLYVKLGNMNLYLKSWDTARGYFEKALELQPELPAGWFGVGSTYAAQRDNQKAVEYLGKAFKSGQYSAKEVKKMDWLKGLKKDSSFKDISKKYLK